jgi:hypothetical protein
MVNTLSVFGKKENKLNFWKIIEDKEYFKSRWNFLNENTKLHIRRSEKGEGKYSEKYFHSIVKKDYEKWKTKKHLKE